jgi:hypothetical protein
MRDSDFKRKLFWECIDNLGSKGRSSAAKLAEPALHIAEQADTAICRCGGSGWLTPLSIDESGVPCPRCNPDGKRQ